MDSRDNGEYLEACDLCGSLDYRAVRIDGEMLQHCRVCGLTGRPEETHSTPEIRSLDNRFLTSALRRIEGDVPAGSSVRMLIIGTGHESEMPESSRVVLDTTVYQGSIESAGYSPCRFDAVVVTRSLETCLAPSRLFAKARTWLTPGGMLLVGGANWDSLERRLRPSRWLRHYHAGRYYPGYGHLREYATRNGFEVMASGTSGRLSTIASILFGSSATLARLASIPFRLIGCLPRMGSTYWCVMAKRGLATSEARLAPMEQMESAPGLATAGYSTSRRERFPTERKLKSAPHPSQ